MGRIKRCHRVICFGMMVVVTIAGILILREYWSRHRVVDYGKLCLQMNKITIELEKEMGAVNNTVKSMCDKKGVSVITIDLKGNTIGRYGDLAREVSLKQLSGGMIKERGDLSRVFMPLEQNNTQFASAIFTVHSKDYREWSGKSNVVFILSIMAMVVMDFLLLFGYVWLLRYIHQPLESLHEEVTQILHGNVDMPLMYDYDDEVGTLCHDVELLRGELQFANRQNETMKENEKNLLACISHDMKTPLFAISSHAEAIKDGIVETREEIMEYTEVILKRVGVMETLVNDILEHSETELQELSIVRKMCYARQYFTEVFEEVKKDFASYGNGIIVSEIPECSILIDKFRIQQVIFNITSNALKYSEYKTNLYVDISLFESEKKKYLLVKIRDEGKGISAADLPFVFERFFRGEKARSSDIPGSGLGLNTSKYIIEKHGGQIECDSVVGKGTTVTFSIPL